MADQRPTEVSTATDLEVLGYESTAVQNIVFRLQVVRSMSDQINLRIRPDQLELIDAAAREMGLSRSQFMIRASLGEPLDVHTASDRMTEFEERLSRVEAFAFGQ